MTDLLQMMDKISHNLYAELMLREAARNNLPDAGSAEAVKQLANYLAGVSVPAGDWKLDDAIKFESTLPRPDIQCSGIHATAPKRHGILIGPTNGSLCMPRHSG